MATALSLPTSSVTGTPPHWNRKLLLRMFCKNLKNGGAEPRWRLAHTVSERWDTWSSELENGRTPNPGKPQRGFLNTREHRRRWKLWPPVTRRLAWGRRETILCSCGTPFPQTSFLLGTAAQRTHLSQRRPNCLGYTAAETEPQAL